MSAEFASVGLFHQGFNDLILAWKFLPKWLLDCVPFIINPPNAEYQFDDVEVEDRVNEIVVNGNIFVRPESTAPPVFENCVEALKFVIENISLAAFHAKEKTYQQMVNIMIGFGNIGPQLDEVCNK